MNIINKKFRYLLDNVFTNITNINDKQISKFNPDESIFAGFVKENNIKKQIWNFNFVT